MLIPFIRWNLTCILKKLTSLGSCSSFALSLNSLIHPEWGILHDTFALTHVVICWQMTFCPCSLPTYFPLFTIHCCFCKILPIPYWHSTCNLYVLNCINSLTYSLSFLWFDSFLVLILWLYGFIINLLLFCLVILLCLKLKYYFLYIFVSSPVHFTYRFCCYKIQDALKT